MKLRLMGITLVLHIALLITGCGSEEETNGNENVNEALDYTITGIEPGAATMGQVEQTLEEYENLNGWILEDLQPNE